MRRESIIKGKGFRVLDLRNEKKDIGRIVGKGVT
jgi:predicted RNA-binding protein YlqC (UPF0109 family)